MSQIFKNNASSRLDAAITAAATSLKVLAGEGERFPTPSPGNFFLVTLDDRRTGQIEICRCTARSGDILTLVRGQENTLAQAFDYGASVSNRLTAGTIELYITPPAGSVQYYWETREQFVSAIAVGFVVTSGYVYVAGKYTYLGKVGATDIPDLPGVIPFGDVHVEHFGAKADMTFDFHTWTTTTTGGYVGPRLLGGTDNLAKFQLADAYTTNITKSGFFYAEEGDTDTSGSPTIYRGYLLVGQFILLGKMISRRNYRNYLWLKNTNVYHSNIFINSSNGGVVGFSIVDQYGRTVAKPGGSGQMGPGITIDAAINEFGGPGFASFEPQPIINDIEIDCQFCRAADDGTVNQQQSSGAYHVFVCGGVEFSKFKVGIFGQTNQSSNGIMLAHWNMQAEPGFGNPMTDYESMHVVETYHCCHCHFEIRGYIDQISNPHGLSCVFELASAGCCTVSDIACRGVFPIAVTPGDAVDFWTNKRQKEKIMKGIRVGFVHAVDCPLRSFDSGIPIYDNAGGSNVIVRAFGTTKWNNDFYETTTQRNTCRQLECDVSFVGMNLRRIDFAPAWNGRGLYAVGCFGKLNFGAVTTYGIGRGFEIEYCDGDQQLNYVEGDGCLLYEFSRGGRLLQTDANRDRPGYVENAGDGAYRPGIGPGTRVISASGGSYSTIVTVPVGKFNATTKTYITPFAGADDDVYKGTPLKIGDYWVTATEFIQGRSAGGSIYPGKDITNITKATVGVITSPEHGFGAGKFVTISGVVGMTQMNGKSGPVTVIDEDNFSIGINTSSYSPYVSGGLATQDLEGVGYLAHTPLPAPAVEGASVTVDEYCRIKQLSVTSSGGETAARLLNASADNCDMHGLRSAGKYGTLMTNARMSLRGPLPMTVGRTPGVGSYTVYADSTSLFSMTDGTILDNKNVDYHLKTIKNGATNSMGHFELRNCRIENIAKLLEGNDSGLRYTLSMYGCTDNALNQLLSHPARQGLNSSPVGPPGGLGYWHYGDDGFAHAWLRSATTNASGVYVWTFPIAFNGGGGTVVVTVTPRTTFGAARSFSVGTQNSITCTITCSAAEVVSFDAYAVGRWFAETPE